MERMKRAQVTVPLDIPDVRVLLTEINKVGELIITIESIQEGTLCRQCGREIRKRHGYDEWMIIRHLPVFGRPSYLRYRPRRYQCLECEGSPTTTQRLEWRESNSPHSMVYDDHLLLQLVNSTVEDVSIKEGVAYDCVLGVLERRISASVDWGQYTALGVVGLDEIALKKGQRNFVVIVTARLADGRPLIIPVTLTDLSPTLTADGALFGALDGDDQFANLVDFYLQYPHIGYVQRNRDLCSSHPLRLPLTWILFAILPPISGGYHGNSQ